MNPETQNKIEEAKLPRHITALLTDEGYFKMFNTLLCEYNNNEDTFDALETIYKNFFRKNRYTSYESFRAAKSRYLKQKKQNQ